MSSNSPWGPILELPKFNTYFFAVCSAAHIVRLLTGTVSPYLSALIFVFEYGLLSSFIETSQEEGEGKGSISDLIDRHRDDIVAVAKWYTGTPEAAPQAAVSAAVQAIPIRGILDSCSDSCDCSGSDCSSDDSSDSDSEVEDDIATLTSLLKKK